MQFDLDTIRKRYFTSFNQAVKEKMYQLPYYEIQSWDKVLNHVQKRIFEDIRVIGVPLYPIWPVSPLNQISFGNPFNKVGIEIIYKNSSADGVKRKLDWLKSINWTMYEIDSRKTYYTFNEFCDFLFATGENKIEFDNLDFDEALEFFEKYKNSNSGCLLHYINQRHFSEYKYRNNAMSSDLTNISALLSELHL